MDINIYVNQKKINPLYKKAVDEYVKRLSPYCRLSIVCACGKIKCSSSAKNAGYAITASTHDGCHTISSVQYADLINSLASGGISAISYYVGYPTEITGHMSSFAVSTLSSGCDMTALLLSEQIYRAYTIQNHITYHK